MMFDSFTPPARAVVMGAQQQAKQLGHNYMGTEHVLFALPAAEQAAGGGVLSQRGVTLRAAQAEAATRSAAWTTDATALRAVGIDPAAVTDQARQHLRRPSTDTTHHAQPACPPTPCPSHPGQNECSNCRQPPPDKTA
jgi:ATP-dependent Clp protease ATP-binding subunit ClpA